jgi:hypothetical protein
MYLDILEGDSAEVIPSSINVGQSLNVTVVIGVNCSTSKNNVMSSIKVTLASKNGYFSVTSSSYNISSVTANATAKANFEITGASAGNDTMYINASAKNTHKSSISFSDSYGTSPSLTVSNASNQAPSIGLTGPSAGSNLTGGSVYRLNWTATDDNLAGCKVALFYSTDGFSSSNNSIASNLTAASSVYNWTLPRMNSTTVGLKAIINDPDGLSGQNSTKSNFTIDSVPPAVEAAWPANGSTDVPWSGSLVLNFSEPMNQPSAEAAFSISPDPGGLNWSWNQNATSMTGTLADLNPGTQYNCSLSGFNDSSMPGNQNSSRYSWTFSTAVNNPPAISFTAPSAGADLSGGAPTRVGWNGSDEDRFGCTVSLFYSTDGFSSSNTSIAGNLSAGSQPYNWTVPRLDSTTVRVKGIIRDGQGLVNESLSSNFTVDSTAPSIVKVSPAAGATNVYISALITITFSEPVNATGALSGFGISPDPNGFVWTWNGNGTSVSAIHSNLDTSTVYTCSISGYSDLSDPGNSNKTALLWNFTTSSSAVPMPSVVLAEPSGGEMFYWGDRITAKWSAAGGTGNLTVNVSISQNGTAGPFKPVASSVPNSGSYVFDAPEMVSGSCILRLVVCDDLGMEANDSSPAPFSIARPLSMSAVFGAGSVIYVGDSVAISWAGIGGLGEVSVTLSIRPGAGAGLVPIASGLPASGNLTWVASGQASDGAVLVLKASDGNGRSVENLSAPFALADPLNLAASFSHAGVLYSGEMVDVSWQRTGGYRDVALSLLLRTGSGPDRTVAGNLSVAGSLEWTAPELDANGAVLVLVAADQGGMVVEKLSAPFSLARALRIAGSFPMESIVYSGDRVNVGWDRTGGYRDVTVSLWLRAGGGADLKIGSADFGAGSFWWTAPELDAEGARLVLAATDGAGRAVENASMPFSVVRSLRIAADFPVGSVAYSGSPAMLSWNCTGGFGNVSVSLEFCSSPGGPATPVAWGLRKAGSLSWTAPDVAADGAVLSFVATDGNGRSAGNSSRGFPVARPLRLTALFPTGGAVTGGTVTTLAWDSTGGLGEVSLSLYLVAGGQPRGSPVASGLPRTGSLGWKAPDVNLSSATLVLVATDQNGMSAEAVSAPFSVRTDGAPPVQPPGNPPGPPSSGLDLNALPAVGLIILETRVVEDTLVTFDASTSSDPEGGPLRFGWDFGDGTTPVQNGSAVQVHLFGKPGKYQVRLSVSDGRDPVNRTVVMTVVPRPSGPAAQPQGIAIPAGFWVVLAFVVLVVAGLYYAHLDARRGPPGTGAGRDFGTPGQADSRPDGTGDGPAEDGAGPPRGPRTRE